MGVPLPARATAAVMTLAPSMETTKTVRMSVLLDDARAAHYASACNGLDTAAQHLRGIKERDRNRVVSLGSRTTHERPRLAARATTEARRGRRPDRVCAPMSPWLRRGGGDARACRPFAHLL